MTQLFSDTFDRANSDIIGGNWTEVTLDWDIVSNGVRAFGTLGGVLTNTSSLGTADYKVTANITAGGMWTGGSTGIGILGRYVDANNNYFAWLNGSNNSLELYRIVGGSLTQLGSSVFLTPTPTDPVTLALSCQGTTISVELNGVQRISLTDTSLSGPGNFGLRIYNPNDFATHLFNSLSVDDFVSGPVTYPITRGLTQAQALSLQTLAGHIYPLTRAVVQGQAVALLTTVTPAAPPYRPRPPRQLDDVFAGFKHRLDTIDGLRASTAEPDHPNFPAAYPRLLEGGNSDFDGDIEYLFEVWAIVGLDSGFNRAQNEVAPYLSPKGRKSIQCALEGDPTLNGTVSYAWVEAIGLPQRLDMAGVTVYGGNVRVRVFA